MAACSSMPVSRWQALCSSYFSCQRRKEKASTKLQSSWENDEGKRNIAFKKIENIVYNLNSTVFLFFKDFFFHNIKNSAYLNVSKAYYLEWVARKYNINCILEMFEAAAVDHRRLLAESVFVTSNSAYSMATVGNGDNKIISFEFI